MDRYPLNAPGPFYVVNGACITCMVPEHYAPTLMGFYEDPGKGGRSHCFFKKQPSNPMETDQALNAVIGSCCNALRYGGNDPDVIKRVPPRLCDQHTEGKQP